MRHVKQFSPRSDRAPRAVRNPHAPRLPLVPVLSLAALVVGVGQTAQANDSTVAFQQVATNPPEASATPGDVVAIAPRPQPDSSNQDKSGNLSFDLPPVSPPQITVATTAPPPAVATPASNPQELKFSQAELFVGGSRSLVAKAVGAAEGTRTPDGHKTPAYYGHVDPGNRAWNLGSFSYQHGADSPEEADRKQLARLAAQAEVLRQQAQTRGLELSLEEELNGIDLANQAPQAALDTGGYIDRLAQARQLGLKGSEAVTWARTHAFFDPATGRLNAPGLGNRVDWVFQDQERRRSAVERAIALHQPSGLVAAAADALIHADTGNAIAQATPEPDAGKEVAQAIPVAQASTPTPPSPDLSFSPNRVEASIAQAVPETKPTEPEAAAPTPSVDEARSLPVESLPARTIPSWGEQNSTPAIAEPSPILSRLAAQAARARGQLRSLERMRSLLPVPTPPPSAPVVSPPPAPPEGAIAPVPAAPSSSEQSELPQTRVQATLRQTRRVAPTPAPQPTPSPESTPTTVAPGVPQSQPESTPTATAPQPRAEVADQLIGFDLSEPPPETPAVPAF